MDKEGWGESSKWPVVKIGAVEEFFCPTLVSFILSVCMQE